MGCPASDEESSGYVDCPLRRAKLCAVRQVHPSNCSAKLVGPLDPDCHDRHHGSGQAAVTQGSVAASGGQ